MFFKSVNIKKTYFVNVGYQSSDSLYFNRLSRYTNIYIKFLLKKY